MLEKAIEKLQQEMAASKEPYVKFIGQYMLDNIKGRPADAAAVICRIGGLEIVVGQLRGLLPVIRRIGGLEISELREEYEPESYPPYRRLRNLPAEQINI